MTSVKKTPEAFKQACQQIELLLFDCDGVLTDGRIILGSNGFEAKCFSTTDGMALKIWKTAGFKAGAITGRSSDALSKRAEELKFDELHQGIARKGEILKQILAERQLEPEQVAYIGDDINDLPVGARVGLFFVPANHHPSIRPYADFILDAAGGHGVIREAVDIILGHKNMLEKLIAGFLDDK
jgi:3-deoxy-D-manno-octulosonate 8-phosphate phosphatase (KDO 8-P phosphatase)